MHTSTKVLIGVGVVATGVGGFVGFRRIVRSKAREALIRDYGFDKIFSTLELAEKLSGKDWNIPNFEEFLEGITPTWTFTMPAEAIDDVIANGRNSIFWPAQYRQPAGPDIEEYIFTAIRGATSSSGNLITDVIAAATANVAALANQKAAARRNR